MHINSITLTGTALSNPEQRFFESGTVRTRFTVMVDTPFDPYVSRDTDGCSELLVLTIELWGRNAQLAADQVRSGRGVAVTGQLRRSTATGAPVIYADRLDVGALCAPRHCLHDDPELARVPTAAGG